jgi:xylulokinase
LSAGLGPSLLGLDVGTTGCRAIAIDLDGNVLGSATATYPLQTPRPGWTEQDPERWWIAAQSTLKQVAELAGRPLGLGLTGQMHGAVFLDGSGAVIRPALLWNDQRTARQCEAITERIGADKLLEITGNVAVTGFQSPKITWLHDEEPDAYRRVRHVLLPKDFIRLRLTGELATDASDASGTLLLDMRTRDWSSEILDRLEIPRKWLPVVCKRRSAARTAGWPRGRRGRRRQSRRRRRQRNHWGRHHQLIHRHQRRHLRSERPSPR